MNKPIFRTTSADKKKFKNGRSLSGLVGIVFVIIPAEKRMNSLVVSIINSKENLISICAPKSLQRWRKLNEIQKRNPSKCDVKIQEIGSGR